MKIKITDEYRKVKDLLHSEEPIVFVTGKAGTGKSTLIHYLRKTTKANCVVLAPTGVAAMNVQGATIHSFFRFPPRLLTDDDAKEVRFKAPYKNIDLLILDEVSMIRADVLDAIDLFLRFNGPHKALPFGGIQVVLVGDLHQLPPVVSSSEEAECFRTVYDGPFFFSSRVLAGANIAAVELTHVFRQKDDRFLEILNTIRVGEVAGDLLDEINTRVTPKADPKRETILSTTNLIADRINKSRLASLPSLAQMYVGTAEGRFQLTNDRLPSPMELLLKVDARVMFTKNDPGGRWVNGSLGTVKTMNKNRVRVRMDDTGEILEVEKTSWETYQYEYDEDEERHVPVVTGSFKQLPLAPAWAITIHKSQGKTLSAARIDLGRSAFAPGQVYVGLSRCRTLGDLSLSRPISARDIFCDHRAKAFYDSLF